VRKLRGHEIAIGALAATAFWAVFFVLTSNGASDIIGFAFRKIGSSIDVLSALITAVATIFIAGFTFTLKRSTDRLWEASKDQTALTEKSLTLLEGPILIIGTMTMDYQPPPAVPTIQLQFKNHGRGPAIIMECFAELIKIGIAPYEPPVPLPKHV
jgi:hypothetical protein